MPPTKKRKVQSTLPQKSKSKTETKVSDSEAIDGEGRGSRSPIAGDGGAEGRVPSSPNERGGLSQDTTGSTSEIIDDPAFLDEEEAPGDDEPPPSSPRKFPTSYNALKSFKGQVYSGMSIGSSHTWNYDQGVWQETKEEPDLWKIDYSTTKRRARNAPKGIGALVGTEYHWYNVAHQYVRKVDANTYTTHLVGSKYKFAHKNANSESWSINTVKGQRERELFLLDDSRRRVEGLPPVLGAEKVKVARQEKGQKTIESSFGKAAAKTEARGGEGKRKQDETFDKES